MSIVEICVTLMSSFILIGIGLYTLKHGFFLFATRDRLWKNLMRWQVFGDAYPSPQTLADIKQSWCYLHAMTVIGGGVGVLLMGISMVMIALATTGTVDGIDPNDASFFLAIFYGSLFVGFGMGGLFAVWRLRRTAMRKVTYADLRQRRLSDYRGRLLPWMPLVAMMETVAFGWFFAPHLGTTLRLLQSDGATVDVPNSLWMLSIVPGAMVVISLVAEFLMSRLARLSRLLITSDPLVSQRVDDMLRATVIGMMQVYELLAVLWLGLLQAGLVLRSLWASGYWQMGNRPYSAVADVFFLLLVLTLGLGGGLAAAHSPLGGKLSGWPWHMKQVKQPGAQQ